MENNQDDRQRFAALIREHSHSMFRAARAILDCDADAEDAVGEAVLLPCWTITLNGTDQGSVTRK